MQKEQSDIEMTIKELIGSEYKNSLDKMVISAISNIIKPDPLEVLLDKKRNERLQNRSIETAPKCRSSLTD